MTATAVIGGGHNGLVCATYLARAGLDVTVFEANDEAGGCVWTETLDSGHRLERGAIDHGPILDIVAELELERFGLDYLLREVSVGAGYGDGTRISFAVDLETTLAAIASLAPDDVAGYRRLARLSNDLLGMMGEFTSAPSLAELSAISGSAATDPVALVLSSADKVVSSHVANPYLRSALTMYGSHSQLPAWLPGTGLFGMLLAGSHGHAPGRPRGGSIALIDALAAALQDAGGALRSGAAVTAVTAGNGGAAVSTSAGEQHFDAVVSTIDAARTAALVDPVPADLARAADLAVSGAMNVAELKVDLALSAPAVVGEFGDEEAIWLLQDQPGHLDRSFGEIIAGRLPASPALMWAAPSALDDTAAPAGEGTAWLSAFVPARRSDGPWDSAGEAAAAEWLLNGFEAITRVPVRDDIVDMRVTGPASWQHRIGARLGNPNHIDMTVDQLFSLRPPTGGGYRTAAPWLYLSGAGTYPGGGLTGLPGRNAAMALLGDLGAGRSKSSVAAEAGAMLRGWRLYRTLRSRT